MLGSKKRDYKTESIIIMENLREHYKLMQEFVNKGLCKKEASKKAYQIIIGRVNKGGIK